MIVAFDTKTILHNYIVYLGEQSYVENFPADLGMPMMFADF